MNLPRDALDYVLANPERFMTAVEVHVRLSGLALLIAICVFIPLGVLASRGGRAGAQIVAVVGAARVVPSLAVLFLLLPLMGTGFTPALVALTVLAGPPLIINTDAGLRGVEAAVLENARGLGMSERQVFSRVQWPLALPVVVAGVRSAAIDVVASATLAAFIGAGGLGTFILAGLSLVDYRLLLVGAVPVALLALLTEVTLNGLERLVTPPAA